MNAYTDSIISSLTVSHCIRTIHITNMAMNDNSRDVFAVKNVSPIDLNNLKQFYATQYSLPVQKHRTVYSSMYRTNLQFVDKPYRRATQALLAASDQTTTTYLCNQTYLTVNCTRNRNIISNVCQLVCNP